ncbi:endonuclease/exonuclease/phosphatase family protein [Paenibacillus campi]|uniref:endonuclease/exonuclease/phosphatase family protein n=1 Tax=Paenibacillus campi TaxID=3106031 RepID=UPI002AFEDD25|nr:endonuclease/exonuclease/phosphatase family protein [Paenibacillus sp. SGZ-1014]
MVEHESKPLPTAVKVMTFNLRTYTAYDAGNEWANRALWAAQTIMDQSPTLIGVQEAYRVMLDDLQPQLPRYDWIGEGRRGGSEDEHCAIFYRNDELELLEQGQFWLSETPTVAGSLGWDSDFPRICTWGRFRHRQSEAIMRVYNVHFDHIGEQARLEGAKLVVTMMKQHAAADPNSAGIIMGDMNGQPSEPPLQYLHGQLPHLGELPALYDVYNSLQGEYGRTFHDFAGGVTGEPIDYIFVEPIWHVLSATIERRDFEGKYPSDHYPVIAELALRTERDER